MAHKILNTNEQIDPVAYEFIESISENYDKEILKKAYEFAKSAHENQYRKSGDLYITHPIEVAKLAYKFGLDTDSICAAFLHDVIEDTQTTYLDIENSFNKDIAQIVEGLTKLEQSGLNIKTDIEKNITELRRMLLSASRDIRILVIKLCDRVHNMRTLHSRSESSQKRISKETLYVYAPIAQKIGIYTLKWELEDLAFKYLHPKDFKIIKKKLKLKRETREKIAQKAVTEVKTFLENYNIKNIVVLGRPKSMYSIYRKISKKKIQFEDIYDLYAVRVITQNIEQCYHIQALLQEYFKTYLNREKDYIKSPKFNGYQSIHLTIFSNAISSPIEVQIRDLEMHKLAEYGVAAHWKYKNVKKDTLFDRKISWLRELLQWEQENSETYNLMQVLKFDLFDSEIFAFTPKYDIIALPQGATILDFAYYIHTEVGNTAIRGKLNGNMVNLDRILSNGDVVEIITNPNSKVSEKFLQITKTTKAKTSIRQSLGLKLQNRKLIQKKSPFSQRIKLIEGLDSYSKITNPKCCSFEIKDDIIGVETKKAEISIHNSNCENAKLTLHRKFKLIWSPEIVSTFAVQIYFSKNSGVLIDVLNVLKEQGLTPLKMRNSFNKDGSVYTELRLQKHPKEKITLEKLRNIKGVTGIRKLE